MELGKYKLTNANTFQTFIKIKGMWNQDIDNNSGEESSDLE